MKASKIKDINGHPILSLINHKQLLEYLESALRHISREEKCRNGDYAKQK